MRMNNDRVFLLRESVVKITQMLAGKGLKVTQMGVTAFVKCDHKGLPVLVNLPYIPDNATDELCSAVQGFLDHEVARVLFTDFELMSAECKKAGKSFASMAEIIEGTRVEKHMSERYQGSAYNIGQTGRFYCQHYIKPTIQEKARAGDSQGGMQTLVAPMIRAMAGQPVFEEFMKDKWGTVKPMHDKIKDLEPAMKACASTEDALAITREIQKRWESEGGEGEGEDEPSSSGKSGRPKAGSAKGSKGKGPKPESKEKPEGEEGGEEETESGAPDEEEIKKKEEEEKAAAEGKGKKGEGEEEKEEGEKPAKGEEEEKDEPGEGEGEGEDGEEEEETLNCAPIWEALDKDSANSFDKSMSRLIADSVVKSSSDQYMPYTKDADVIEKMHVGSGFTQRMVTTMEEAVDHHIAPLQKDLERAISARSLAVRSHGHRSGKLHGGNLSRLVFNDPRVFSKKHESLSKDVAVELVIDASGSMSGGKIHTAAQAAYALASVLDRLGIKNEVICFTTKDLSSELMKGVRDEEAKLGRHFSRYEGLYMPILKGFDERITPEVKKRFGWLPNSSILRNNVDGECVEIAARRLLGRSEKGKIMMVLSDGHPAASGSSGELYEHLRQRVKEISGAGVKVVGIGIQSNAVKEFYPKHVILNDVSELPTTVIKELRRLLMG